jgi:Domain of unknown function (DUF1929)
MGPRSQCGGWRLASIALAGTATLTCTVRPARADTLQRFDAPSGGTAYAQTDARRLDDEFVDFGDCSTRGIERLTEGGRSFLRLAHDSAPVFPPSNCNAITFNCVEAATTGEVAIDLDLRVSDPTGHDPADGLSVSLIRAGADLARGGPAIDIDEVAAPAVPEFPDIAGSLGVGFRVYRGPLGNEPENVKIVWAGALIHQADLPLDQTMVDIGWLHVAIRVDFAQRTVGVVLTRGDGSQLLRIPAVAIPSLAPFASRVHLAARAGFATASFDVDEVRVTFPPRDPAVVGSWAPASSLASVPIHGALVSGGRVLYWDRHDQGDGRSFLWNGIASTPSGDMPVKPDSNEMYDAFCAGHTFAADGSLFVAGGHIADLFGEPWASRFDPASRHWSALPAMQAGRWYPTTTTLPDGNIAVVSGAINPFATNDIPEIYDARANRWRALTGAERTLPLYPFMFATPRGLFAAGAMVDTGYLDVASPGRWLPVDRLLAGRDPPAQIARDYGSAVLTDAARGRILLAGGTSLLSSGPRTLRTTEWIDLSAPQPRWQLGPAMTFARRMHVATQLPDGSVLVTGGTASDAFNRADGAILNPELLTDLDDAWQPMACGSEARVYHSIAMLLPDARVLVAGGGHPGEIDHATAEVFSPPYLHRGPQLDAPAIVASPGVVLGPDGVARVRYGATITFTTPDPARVAGVTWMRPAAVTHAFNQDQRIVRLAAGPGGLGGIAAQVIAPSDPAIAPPGPYLMFLLDTRGVPSRAAWVRTNLPPDAVDDAFDIVEDQVIDRIVERITGNDVDVEHDAITVAIVDPPRHGQIVDGAYHPATDFAGDDRFTYRLSDGVDTSRIATVVIRIADVADPPGGPGVPGSGAPPDDAGCCSAGASRSPISALILAAGVLAIVLGRRRRRCSSEYR